MSSEMPDWGKNIINNAVVIAIAIVLVFGGIVGALVAVFGD